MEAWVRARKYRDLKDMPMSMVAKAYLAAERSVLT